MHIKDMGKFNVQCSQDLEQPKGPNNRRLNTEIGTYTQEYSTVRKMKSYIFYNIDGVKQSKSERKDKYCHFTPK